MAAHEPTDKTRAEVGALVSFGNTQDEIANYIGITADTLSKYYKHEMETSLVRANAQVARALFNKAVNENDFSAQCFWLKTRARWRTKDSDETRKFESVVEKLLLNKLTE